MNVSKRELLAELKWVQRFVEKKTTIPILAHVAMESGNGRISLMGTNLEIHGLTSVPCQGDDEIRLTAPIRQLTKFLEGCKDGYVQLSQVVKKAKRKESTDGKPDVEVTYEAYSLTVITSTGQASFECLGLASFPTLPVPPLPTIELSGLNQSIPKSLIAISKEYSRFTLNGALMECSGETGRFITTDGHRLAVVPITCKNGGADTKTMIHHSAMVEASHVNGGHMYFGEDAHHQLFLTGRRSIIARKLTGKFPDWERALPKNTPIVLTMDPLEAKAAIAQVAKFADARSQCIRFRFEQDRPIKLSASTYEMGSASAEIACTYASSEHANFEVGYKASYILDFLNRSDGAVTVKLVDEKSAISLEDSTFRCIVMPMRI